MTDRMFLGNPSMRDFNETTDALVGLMDYTLLDHNASEEELHLFCEKANAAKPAAICVFAEQVHCVKEMLGEGILVAAVCGGFPVGSSVSDEVVASIELAVSGGADEIDIVLEPKDSSSFPGSEESGLLTACRLACGSKTLKVIIETPLLNKEQVRLTCQMALTTGADFIKSCTGKRGGCSIEAATIMSSELKSYEASSGIKRGIKISGGIQTRDQAVELLATIILTHPNILGSCNGEFTRQDSERIRIGASSLLKNLMPTLFMSQDSQPELCAAAGAGSCY